MRKTRRINWDGLGIITSALCAIHCAAVPLLAGLLPLVGLNFLRKPLFEYGMIGLAFAIGSWALWHGYWRHHRRIGPSLLFVAGMMALIAKEVWSDYELYFLPFAVAFILVAHVLNYRYLCRVRLGGTPTRTGGTPTTTEIVQVGFRRLERNWKRKFYDKNWKPDYQHLYGNDTQSGDDEIRGQQVIVPRKEH